MLVLVVAVGAVLLAGGAVRRSELRHRERLADRQIDDRLEGKDRFVDFGVRLLTVEQDLANGQELMPGRPPLRVIGERPFGGTYDTLTRRWVGPSRRPVTWLVSPDQYDLAVHDGSAPPGVWMQGSMGSGKTTTGAIWLGLRVIKFATRTLQGAGVTAPIDKRMEEIRKTLFGAKDAQGARLGGMWPRSWFTWREGDQVAVMATGLQIDFRTTHVQSAEVGSPIQGQNWAFVWNDELQDYYALDGDIRMRGRAAWGGRYERFVTATPKDSHGYRNFRAKVETSSQWLRRHVIGPKQPFQWQSWWDEQIADMDPREARRKIFAEDVGPERMLYHTWARTLENGAPGNLRPIPDIHAEDVTAEVLAPWGPNLTVLVGHDPGKLYDVSVLLKAYRLPKQRRHVWWIVGEVTTASTTTEQHVVALLKVLRDRFHCNDTSWRADQAGEGPRALVRADPYSESGTSTKKPDKGVFDTFRAAGLICKPAVYGAVPKGGGAPGPGTVPKEGRIDMMCRLLCDAFGNRRLFVACDDRGQPAAPRVVQSFEHSQRSLNTEAETEKGLGDLSHWTTAPGYALWLLERPRNADEAGGQVL